jgi:hypothetical protein
VEREPAAPGVKVTVKVHDALAAIEPLAAAHEPVPEFVIAKSPEFPPLTEGLMLVAVVLVLFVSVKVIGELDEPTLTDPKLSGEGESITPNGSF